MTPRVRSPDWRQASSATAASRGVIGQRHHVLSVGIGRIGPVRTDRTGLGELAAQQAGAGVRRITVEWLGGDVDDRELGEVDVHRQVVLTIGP